MVAEESGGGLSRRRVLQGTAWSVPAIMIAAAAPAAAAGSDPVAGGVVLVDLTAAMTETLLSVGGSVAYVGASGDLPVTGVVVGVRVPADRLTANPVSVLTPSWQPVSNDDSTPAETVFTFMWMGAALDAANPITLPFEAQLSKAGPLNPLTVTFTADGLSGPTADVPVPQDSQDVDAVIGANLVLNVGESAIRYQVHDGAAGTFRYHYTGSTRWAGPYYPPGTPATDITVTARIPYANSTGVLVATALGAGWSLNSGPTLIGGQWRVVYKYDTALQSGADTTTNLEFGLIAKLPAATYVTNLRTEGVAAGTTVYDSLVGPHSVVIADD